MRATNSELTSQLNDGPLFHNAARPQFCQEALGASGLGVNLLLPCPGQRYHACLNA